MSFTCITWTRSGTNEMRLRPPLKQVEPVGFLALDARMVGIEGHVDK
jgi:hypothetical protein